MRNRGVNDPAKSAARQPTRSEGVVHATVPGVTVVGREGTPNLAMFGPLRPALRSGKLAGMKVNLSADMQAKLARIARERGMEPEVLAQEAVERMVNYDDWFLREVDKGLAQAERGETLSHEEVAARLKDAARDESSLDNSASGNQEIASQ